MPRATARSIHLLARPQGVPTTDLFAIVEHDVPDIAAGQALVSNRFLSVDPYMRQLMDDGWPLNAPLGQGRAIGRVVASRAELLPEGAWVFHTSGWSTHAVVAADQPGVRVVEPADGIPLSHYLSVLGGTGLTAYAGMRAVLDVQYGESVFVTSAAGGVGSVAGQIARLLGAGLVVGSTGSVAKVEHATKVLGFGAAFDYHTAPVADLLAQAAPDGVDAVLEGVGGEHLEAAIESAREFGRIAWVGAISTYNDRAAAGAAPRNIYAVHDKSLTLRGYMVRHYQHLRAEAEEWMVPHLRSGELRADEHYVIGIERTVDAFLGVLGGQNIGKMLVDLPE
jgi:NADPH-dependent curcumin reductase CurA